MPIGSSCSCVEPAIGRLMLAKRPPLSLVPLPDFRRDVLRGVAHDADSSPTPSPVIGLPLASVRRGSRCRRGCASRRPARAGRPWRTATATVRCRSRTFARRRESRLARVRRTPAKSLTATTARRCRAGSRRRGRGSSGCSGKEREPLEGDRSLSTRLGISAYYAAIRRQLAHRKRRLRRGRAPGSALRRGRKPCISSTRLERHCTGASRERQPRCRLLHAEIQ